MVCAQQKKEHTGAGANGDGADPGAELSPRLLLGRLHKTLGEPQTASDCFARALEAEFTMPLREVVFERTLFTGSEGWS